jgi:hypothetical protein
MMAVLECEDGSILVASFETHAVVKYTADSIAVAAWGTSTAGTRDGQFNGPIALCATAKGVLVGDNKSQRCQLWV